MKFKTVIFDLDGTLVNTIADIAGAVNHGLGGLGFPEYAEDDFYSMVGWGWRNLCTRCLPQADRDEETVQKLYDTSFAYYSEHPSDFSKPYPGIPELIAKLKQKKIQTAVLSNKLHSLTLQVIQTLFPSGSFDLVFGERKGVPRKPDPQAVWEILLELDSSPRQTIFAGDSELDMETARAADCHGIGVSWGFRGRELLEKAGAERVVSLPEEILELVSQTRM
ncbi:MAG: HAD family hydrolase [Spirochaetaceae bacterium]|jgi:phosphoglycolate phosphatase|nr:HAD family hydrolase [Spirochaetaceae bacterium]